MSSNQEVGESPTLRPRSFIAQVASVLSKVEQFFREPLVWDNGRDGEPRLRYDRMELAALEAQLQECGECGCEGLQPQGDYGYGILTGKMNCAQTVVRNPDDFEGVRKWERDLTWQVWFHRQRRFGFVSISEADARRKVLEQTGRHDIDLEPCSKYQFGVLIGRLSAVRWILGRPWDSVET